jgi:very-short-patch-repair endonuclease
MDGSIVNFYCHATRVIIEIDSEVHKNQREYDRERDRLLQSKDVSILNFQVIKSAMN